jgi:hypothetical protein
MQTANTAYTLTVANVDDVLGASVNVNAASAVFTGYVQVAGLLINEISPAITGSHDLVELRVTSAGTINGVKLLQIGSATETLATLPNANVAAGDLIVIHLVGSTATGAAPASETTGKSQYAYAMYTANYDTAWDVLDGTTGLTNGNRVLELQTVTGTVLDAVPVVLSSSGSPPAAFPGVLQTLQANNLWLPVDCGGQPCTYVSTPTAIAISVDYLGVGTSATGNSVARKPGFNTRQKSDWNAAAAQSFGLPNP